MVHLPVLIVHCACSNMLMHERGRNAAARRTRCTDLVKSAGLWSHLHSNLHSRSPTSHNLHITRTARPLGCERSDGYG